jgi:hypothetical protein
MKPARGNKKALGANRRLSHPNIAIRRLVELGLKAEGKL